MEFWSYSHKHFGFWPYPYKHWNSYLISFGCKQYWNSGPIFVNIGFFTIMILHCEHCNSCPIFIHIGILILSFQTLEYSSHLFTANMEILAPPFQTMEFWPYFYKLWNYDLIRPNIGILALFYTQWNSGLILINTCLLSCPSTAITGILVLFSQTLIWILPLFLYTLQIWRHSSKHCSFGPICMHIEVLILSF